MKVCCDWVCKIYKLVSHFPMYLLALMLLSETFNFSVDWKRSSNLATLFRTVDAIYARKRNRIM